ncbi:MAG: YicC/YloC family endoribonuclease [Candidatus Omnitrophota bacterium]|jgi:uncharacterized protein (TIGR00255 family)
MINSMTGFGSREAEVKPLGKICVELRSTNHKFLEIVLHLPEGFLSLEERIKKEIEKKVKRGRIVCVVNISSAGAKSVFVNQPLLKNYIAALKKIKEQCRIKDSAALDTLIHLPGVLSSVEENIPKAKIWPHIREAANRALNDLAMMRRKEGAALAVCLAAQARALRVELEGIKARFGRVMKEKAAALKSDEERAAFLKNTDITEEIERMAFHIRNFTRRLKRSGPLGKELDFIAQEMQRESNTIGAKSCDALISGRVVQLKSRIEKIREQVQNIE